MVSPFVSENELEITACEWLADLGWKVENWEHETFPNPNQESPSVSLLEERLEAALKKFNPEMPEISREEALTALRRPKYDNLTLENERLHNLLTKGVNVTVRKPDGVYKYEYASIIDFKNPKNNDFLAVRQLWMAEGQQKRRADIALYVNGMMLGLIELKSPSNDYDIEHAYQQLQTYKAELPSFLRFNEFLIISDGIISRIGSLTADFRRFMNWRTPDQAKTNETLKNLLKGVCAPNVFLDLISCAIAFKQDSKQTVKILAGYHQYYALKKAVPHILAASQDDQRGGVIWHTQGAGKSLLMAFLTRALIQQSELKNPTILILTDRNDLDDQLFQTFCEVQKFLTATPQQAATREDLRRLLARNSGGIIFSTLQKFGLSETEEAMPLLSDRQNIIVLADEAHRSQYGLGQMLQQNGKIKSGLALNVRHALPNATFVGFTGTPLEKEDKSTTGLFGDYLDIYDISQAVLDEVTVPVYYEPHLIPLDLDKDALEEIKEKYDEVAEEEEENIQRQLAYLQIEKLMGSKPRLKELANHLVTHFETRQESQEVPGKGMIVGFSRKVCADLYAEIIALRPEWHDDSDDKGVIKVIMTSTASDGPELAKHKSTKQRLGTLAERIKNPEDPLKLVIVRDMWLTGFDAPCLNVLYIDKPMKEHGLMQAMARVNRVSKGKKSGLVVDYVGIAEALRKALNHYAKNSERSGEKEIGINIEVALKELQKRFKIVQDFFNPTSPNGINYSKALKDDTKREERLKILGLAIEYILALRQKEIEDAKEDKQKIKEAKNRFPLAVKALKTAWALVPSHEEAQKISKDLGFFLAVAAQIGKDSLKTGQIKSRAEMDQAIRALMEKALHADETIDILALMGIDQPEVEVLSEAFLHKLSESKQRNLAVEALERLLADRIQKISRTNQTKGGLFSEKLQALVNQYNLGQLTAAQMLEELIKHAKELNKEIQESEESPFSPEEIAFYDALSKNASAVEALKKPVLREMAEELVEIVKRNATVDWMRTEQGRAKMRIAIKRLLKKYKYPPDLEKEAIQRIIAQAELNASNETRTL